MAEYTGFRFGNIHSSQYHILRVSDGSRYNDSIAPEINSTSIDLTQHSMNGSLFFGAQHGARTFDLNFAFDSVTEMDIRNMRNWLSGCEIKDLIFDEKADRLYRVKVNRAPELKYICFDQDGKRVYKGEGTIEFIAYYPYARSIQPLNALTVNNGDMPTPVICRTISCPGNWTILLHIRNLAGSTHFNFSSITLHEEDRVTNLEWNTKTGLVTGTINGVTRALNVEGQTICAVPIGYYPFSDYTDSIGYYEWYY